MEAGPETELREIVSAIEDYAKAYSGLERLQTISDKYLPFGDQKTGVIAEFYARLYAKEVYPKASHRYGTTSERGWDIKLEVQDEPNVHIQVKAVSEHSKTSRISPIHDGWDKLWLVRLDKRLKPTGFWTLEATDVAWANVTQSNRTMPKPGTPGSGSNEFKNAADRSEHFLRVLRSVLGTKWLAVNQGTGP